LTEGAPLGDETWAYVPTDTSLATLRAIVTHPSVADTDGINRRTFTIGDDPPLTPRRGGLIAGAPAWMARGARAMAYALGIAALLSIGAVVALVAARAVPRRVRALHQSNGALPRLGNRITPRAWIDTRISAISRQAAAAVAMFLLVVAWRFLTFTGFRRWRSSCCSATGRYGTSPIPAGR
jgi:hypothetical protein